MDLKSKRSKISFLMMIIGSTSSMISMSMVADIPNNALADELDMDDVGELCKLLNTNISTAKVDYAGIIECIGIVMGWTN